MHKTSAVQSSYELLAQGVCTKACNNTTKWNTPIHKRPLGKPCLQCASGNGVLTPFLTLTFVVRWPLIIEIWRTQTIHQRIWGDCNAHVANSWGWTLFLYVGSHHHFFHWCNGCVDPVCPCIHHLEWEAKLCLLLNLNVVERIQASNVQSNHIRTELKRLAYRVEWLGWMKWTSHFKDLWTVMARQRSLIRPDLISPQTKI